MNVRQRTISLAAGGSSALANDTVLLEVEVPGLSLALVVCDGESENGLGLLDSVLAQVLVLQALSDEVESSGGSDGVCREEESCC